MKAPGLTKPFLIGLSLGAILVIPHTLAQSVPAGKEIFEAQCVGCHNADSTEAKDGPGLKGIKDGKLPSGARATHDTILEILDKGRDLMPSFKELLTSQQKEDVIAYVLTL